MGKEGELWDDSALINAFDKAMSNYKKMHGMKSQDDSTDGGKVAGGGGVAGENISIGDDNSHANVREADGNNNITSDTATELGETKNLAPVKESNTVGSFGPEPYNNDSSNGPHVQTLNGYSYLRDEDDYNQLLSQYYELEDKRQTVLQQLHQFGGYNNYQCPTEASGSGVHQGTYSTSQDQSVAANQASHSSFICSCCPYASHCSVAPCSSFPACSLSGTCFSKICTDFSTVMGPGKSLHLIDGDVVKTAMAAAERAISSMKIKTSVNSGTEEEKSKDSEGEMTQSASSETDLSVVLNAWYSAGFYTGKYLTEQSTAKKWHG